MSKKAVTATKLFLSSTRLRATSLYTEVAARVLGHLSRIVCTFRLYWSTCSHQCLCPQSTCCQSLAFADLAQHLKPYEDLYLPRRTFIAVRELTGFVVHSFYILLRVLMLSLSVTVRSANFNSQCIHVVSITYPSLSSITTRPVTRTVK